MDSPPLDLIIPPSAKPYIELQRTDYEGDIEKAYSLDMHTLFLNIKPFLPEKPRTFLDIGAGIGGIDAKLSRVYQESTFYLLDRDYIGKGSKVGWHDSDKTFAPYNSFDETRKFMTANGVAHSQYELVDRVPAVDFDVVMSFLSWGFHYPVETYLTAVLACMHGHSVLIMDIRKGTNGIDVLSERMNAVEVIGEGKKIYRVICKK
jgi:hypothetical protein